MTTEQKDSRAATKNNAALRDRQLERLVAASMNARRDRWLARLRIDAKQGIVTLSGYVSSAEEKQIAFEAAAGVRGVGRPIDKLVVDKEKAGKEAKPITAPSELPRNLIMLGGSAAVALIAAVWWWAVQEPAKVTVPVFPVEGTAHFVGEPMEGALLVFHPKDGGPDAIRPKGTVAFNGQLRVGTYQTSDGAPEGEYLVTVEWHKTISKGGEFEPGPNLLPPKYASPKTTPLQVRVWEGPTNRLQFKLTR